MGDVDNDGDLDIHVANADVRTANGQQNKLWINHLPAIAKGYVASDIADDTGAANAVTVGDVDNDGDLDIYVASYNAQNKLWINNG